MSKRPQLNWPTATAAMVLGGLGIIAWFVLTYTGKIPAQLPSWYVPIVGGSSYILGAFFDTVRWVARRASLQETNDTIDPPSS